jgi:hypothetical protein
MRSVHTALLALVLAFVLASAADAAPRFVTEIPFDLCRGLICLHAKVDGTPVTMILDTGDAHDFISTEFAKSHGWGLKPYTGGNGKPIPGVFDAGDHAIRLGRLVQPAHFLTAPAADLGTKRVYDANLVYLFFKDRALQIDYPRRELRVSGVLTGAAPHSGARGRLQIVNFHKWGPPIVVAGPFTIDGRAVRAQIDTAYTGTMLVYSAYVAPLGLHAPTSSANREFFPFTDGGVFMFRGRARSEGFADRILDDHAPIVYFAGPGVHQPENPFEATVGNAFFARSVVTMDFHDMTIDVTPERTHSRASREAS